MPHSKKVRKSSKRTATPPDLAKLLQEEYAKKYPHLPPLDSHMKDLEAPEGADSFSAKHMLTWTQKGQI